MTNKEFVLNMMDYLAPEEIFPFVSLTEAAANIQFWREAGIDVPDGLWASELLTLWNDEIERRKSEKAEKPLKVFKIVVTEKLTATYYVEAHDADEADAIFEQWEIDPDNACDIQSDLIESSEGWETGCAVATDRDVKADIPYTKGAGLLG